MTEINPFDSPPVYEATQVVTYVDLARFLREVMYIEDQLPWWKWRQRITVTATISFIDELLKWLENGKPYTQQRSR